VLIHVRNSSYNGKCKGAVVKNGLKGVDTTTNKGLSAVCFYSKWLLVVLVANIWCSVLRVYISAL